MIGVHRSEKIAKALLRQKERMECPVTWNISVVLLPVGLISILLIYTTLETNRRLRSTTQVLSLPDAEPGETNMWLGVAPSSQGIKIQNTEGQSFTLSNENPMSIPEEFSRFLDHAASNIVVDAAVSQKLDRSKVLVTIAVDQSLAYYHVRPLIYALGKAGFSQYGFETIVESK